MAVLPKRGGFLAAAKIGVDFVAGQRPIIVEISDHVFHVGRGQRDGAISVAGVVEQDRQRQLLRAVAIIGPLEAVFGEALHLVVLGQRTAVNGDDKAVDGAFALIGFHEHPGALFPPAIFS
jgi:hypothetical protein